MTKKLQIYKCNTCGNIVEVLVSGVGELVCCGNTMELLEPKNNEDLTTEKHSPKINKYENKTIITLENHPMEDEHYIMFIQAQTEDKNNVFIKYFYPQNKAEMEILNNISIDEAISYCNIHGLYKGTKTND